MLSLAKLEKCFTESDETRKLFLFASQKLIALKTESQKLWRMTGFSDEEFENILAEMSKYS